MENNNLDKFFRDKLKDLKVSAPTDAWETIAERLPRKKKRRPVVLWWSAAAILLALFASSVLYWSFSETTSENIQFVEAEETPKTSPDTIQMVDAENTSESLSEKSYENSLATEANKSENIENTLLQKDSARDNDYRSKSEYNTSINNAIANKSEQGKASVSQDNNEESTKSNESSKHLIAQIEKLKKVEEKESKKTLFAKQYPLKNTNKTTNESSNKQITQVETLNKEEETEEVIEITSLLDEKTLLAAEEEANKQSKEKHGKWSIGPQVAPVYYNSMSSGSSLDNQFNDSGKDGGVNMSLGLQVAYELNDKWQVRSGVHRMNVGYGTNNVQVGYSDPGMAISNINYNNAAAGDIVVTAFSNENLSDIKTSHLANRIEVLNLEGNTQLKQNITYLEVPIEIEHRIIQSEFEWTVIGGVSSLFLTDNNVYVHNSDYSHNIGSASNLEKTSFTTNIGMGFGYNFTKNLHLKLEPMLKYQLNAYTNSVDFKPYMFGVYTGINWKLD